MTNGKLYESIIRSDYNMRVNYLYGASEEKIEVLLAENSKTQNVDNLNIPKITRKCGRYKPSEEDYMNIPEFDIFADISTNFQCFVEIVCMWLGLNTKSNWYFHKLTSELAKVSKKAYEFSMKDIRLISARIGCIQFFDTVLREKMLAKGYDTTMLPVIITVMKYNDIFGCNKQSSTASVSHKQEETELNLLKSETFRAIKAECDTVSGLKEKVELLYTKMGLLDCSKSLYSLFGRVTMTAMEMEELPSIDEVFHKAGIDPDSKEAGKVRTKVSDWINSFCKESKIKRMKVIAFLREIKQIFTT